MRKKFFAWCLFALLIMPFMLAGCKNGNGTTVNDGSTAYAKIDELGNILTLTSATGAKACDGSGMSGSDGRTHYHGNKKEDMWSVAATGASASITFDLGRADKLGKLYVWNYNESGKIDAGLRKVKIFTAVKEDAFTEFKGTGYPFEFKKANGSVKLYATNLMDGNPVDFQGITARYLKLVPEETDGNWGNISLSGLGELRLFRHKNEIYKGNNISANPIIKYKTDGSLTGTPVEFNMSNNSGMSDLSGMSATADNNPDNMYSRNKSGATFWFDLGGAYPVRNMVIWNYNDPAHLDFGVQEFSLRLSMDGVQYTTAGSYIVPKATGSTAERASLNIEFDTDVYTRYICIAPKTQKGNYGGAETGLSEVRFYLGEGEYCDPSPDWTALLSNYEGWSGADGIYSVNLNGKDYTETRQAKDKTFFVFSDTIVSSVDPVTRLRSGVYMPNNTAAVLTGGQPNPKNISFQFPEKGEYAANIKPNPTEAASYGNKNKYYWLGDTFTVGNKLYVYSLKIDSVNPSITGFGFSQTGVDLAAYDIVDGDVDWSSLRLINDTGGILCDAKDAKKDRYYFGGAVYENTAAAGAENPDGYYYVYGYLDRPNAGRNLVVSRVKPAYIEDFSKYEFLGNSGWGKSRSDLKLLAANIAPEISISRIQFGANKGKFMLVYTNYTIGATLHYRIADKPYSEFGMPTNFFTHDSIVATIGSSNNSYNAKAHPALSGENELLITYNVNGDDCFVYADIYRPRFLKLRYVMDAPDN